MGRLNVKTWLGFVLNMLLVLLGISDIMLNGPTEADGLIVLMAGGLLVTGAGMVMLARGNPAGGILGAAGCILFAPIGLICLIGCLQCREKMRNAALAAAAATAETPLAAYGFADDRAAGWLYMLGGFAAFFYGLFYYGGILHDGGVIMAGGEVFSLIGAFRIVRACRRKQEHVCALYRDRLECIPKRAGQHPLCRHPRGRMFIHQAASPFCFRRRYGHDLRVLLPDDAQQAC